jgi:hypothetical protein
MAIAFSDTTNKAGLIQRCEILTGLGDTGISGNATLLKQFTGLINSAYQKVVTMILDAQDDWDWDDTGTTDGSTSTRTDYPVGTIAMVASQRDYTFPASLKMLKVKRVDVTYDNVNYYKAELFDSASTAYGVGNDTTVDGRFSKAAPVYDLKANSIWIYPTASASEVTAGAKVRIEFFREPSEFASTDTTKTPGIDTPFQPLIAILASFEYSLGHDLKRADRLALTAQDYEGRLRTYYSKKDDAQVLALKPYNNNSYE